MEEQICAEEGYTCLQEIHCSEADECSSAEEIVSDDEGKVGGEEESGLVGSGTEITPYRAEHGWLGVLTRIPSMR
jgi:hypothetical protein